MESTSGQVRAGTEGDAQKNNCDPSSSECQVGYMIVEPVFKKFDEVRTLVIIMIMGGNWLRIEGNRSKYAYGYYTKLEVLKWTTNSTKLSQLPEFFR